MYLFIGIIFLILAIQDFWESRKPETRITNFLHLSEQDDILMFKFLAFAEKQDSNMYEIKGLFILIHDARTNVTIIHYLFKHNKTWN